VTIQLTWDDPTDPVPGFDAPERLTLEENIRTELARAASANRVSDSLVVQLSCPSPCRLIIGEASTQDGKAIFEIEYAVWPPHNSKYHYVGPLSQQREVIFANIVAYLAKEQSVDLSISEARAQIEEEAEEMTENWEGADHDARGDLVADTPLQKLLAEYHELGEQILNIRDEGIARSQRIRK
jgi:hypothetical protein